MICTFCIKSSEPFCDKPCEQWLLSSKICITVRRTPTARETVPIRNNAIRPSKHHVPLFDKYVALRIHNFRQTPSCSDFIKL